METETETQPKKSAKGSKKRRKSTNNGPTSTGNITLTTDKETNQQSTTKSARAKAKSRKDSSKRGSSVDEITNTHQSIDETGNAHNVKTASVPSTLNMTQNNVLSSNNPQHYPPAPNGPSTPSAMYRPYGNGGNELTAIDVASQPAASMNGPIHSYSSDAYDSYGTYASPGQYTGAHSSKVGIRPHYPGQMQRYAGPPSGSTPTLNQLLTTPSRYTTQGNYPNFPSGHQMEYNQSNMNPAPSNTNTPHWPSSQPRPSQYGGNQEQQNLEKHGMNMYSQQPAPQYPGHSQFNPSAHRGYPGPQRYPIPPSSQHYNQQQQTYPPGMITPNSSHQYGLPVGRGHPSHSGAPTYSQPPYGHQQSTDPYYNQQSRSMPGYNMSGPNSNYQQPVSAAAPNGPADQGYQPGKMDASTAITQDQNMSGTKTPDSVSGGSNPGFQQQPGYHMKSPGSVTPQPPRTPISQTNMAPSPLTAPHPAISHLRGPSSAPGSPSPGGQARINPLSPLPVRPSTPQQQASSVMRSPSNHSDHAQSPMPGYGVNYAGQQHSYANPQHANPPTAPPTPGQNQQTMMSPGHTMPYSQMQNQGHYTPNQMSSASQIMGPPAVTTPSKPPSQPSTPGTPQSQGSYGGQQQQQQQQQQTGYAMQYSSYGYGPPPAMQGYPPQTPPTERRTSWQGPGQTQVTPQSPQLQGGPPHGQNTLHGQMMPEQPNMPGQPYGGQTSYSTSHQPNTAGQYPAGHPQYGHYNQGQQPHAPNANQQYPQGGQVVISASNSAAVAAAQAAMAAAAHSAKTRSNYPKHAGGNFPGLGQTPPVPNPTMQSSPQQRSLPFHPNYANVQTGSSSNSSMPPEAFPQEQHSATGPLQQDANRNVDQPIPPGPPQHAGVMHPHMQLPHVSMQPGYQGYPMQPPGHPGYDPPGGMSASAGYVTQSATPVYEGMQSPYEDPRQDSRRQTSSSARSASQKLSALYEPDEPGRKEFIDRVLQYWEGKELPLKHAPLMGRRTLDLFTLYQHVKKKGFMQEVTKAKEWPEISNAMGLGNTSTSGFTLKKQYCKYLYGFECRYERGESEPPEALARISEANRKKKQAVEQQQSKAADSQMENKPDGSHAGPSLQHPPHNMPPHSMQYGMQYPPGHYQHQSQHPGMGGGVQMHQNYGGMQSSQMHPGPQYQYSGGPVPSEQMPPYGMPPHQYPPQYQAHHQRPPMAHPSQSGYPTQHSAPGPSPRHAMPPNQTRPPYVPPSQANVSQAANSMPLIISDANHLEMPPSEHSLPPANTVQDTTPTSEPGTAGNGQPKTVGPETVLPEPNQKALPEEKKSDPKTNSSPSILASASVDTKVTASAATDDSTAETDKDPVNCMPTTAETPVNTTSDSTTPLQVVAPAVVTTTTALTTSSTAVTTAETVVTQSHPQPTAVRMAAPNVPYKPNMASPHPGMHRHVRSPGTSFRPPSQPVQLHGVQPSQHYPPQHYPPGQDPYNKQAYSKSNHDMYRAGYTPRGPPPGHYPYPNSPAHVRQSPGPQHHQLAATPQGRPPHHQQPPPSHSPYRTLNNSAPGVMPSHQYPGQGPFPHHGGYPTPPSANTNQYHGMKRSSATNDIYGPPNKMMRPDMIHMQQQYPPGYGRPGLQGQPMYPRSGPDGPAGHHYHQGPPVNHQHTGPRPMHPSMHSGAVQNSSAPPMPPHSYQGYPQHYPPHMRRSHTGMSPVNPASVYSGGPNSSKMTRWKQTSGSTESSTKPSRYPPGLGPDSAAKCLQGLSREHALSPHPSGLPSRMSLPQPYPPPLSSVQQQFKGQQNYQYHPPFKMDNSFPLGCVECTHPRFVKFRRKTKNDVGVHEAWNIIMALKSGLLAESRWALNTLTILLYDQQTIGQIILSQLPGLLHALVSHYRYCLNELFSSPEEIEACFGTLEQGHVVDKDFLEEEMKLFDVVSKCQEDFNLKNSAKRNYLAAPPNLVGVAKKFPVKLTYADDAHIMEREILWEGKSQSLKDTLHIVGTYHQNRLEDDEREEIMEEQDQDQDHSYVFEATLEDILSVPSYIRSLQMDEDLRPGEEHLEPVTKETEASMTLETADNEKERELKENEVNMVERLEETIESMKTADTKAEEHAGTERVSDLNVEDIRDEAIGERRNLHIQSCLERFSKKCDVVLLEDESAGCPGEDVVGMTRSGRFFGGNGGPPFRSKSQGDRETELTQMVLCLSNLFRSLSCSAINHAELSNHRDLMRALSGILLLRHKHRLRPAFKQSNVPEPLLPSAVAKIENLTPEVKEISVTVTIPALKKEFCEIVPENQMNGVISSSEKNEEYEETRLEKLADDKLAENLMDSQKSFKKENAALENGFNNVDEITLDDDEESSVSDKKQLTRENRKLRSAKNGCDEMMPDAVLDSLRIEKGRHDVTKLKCNNNHDTVNNVQTKSKHVMNAIRLPNGPCTVKNDLREENETTTVKSMQNSHSTLPPDSMVRTSGEDTVETVKAEEICLDNEDLEKDEESKSSTEISELSECTKQSSVDLKESVKSERKRLLFSSTVLDPNNVGEKRNGIYSDTWWWDCVQQLREDSLVVLANMSPYLDLAKLPDDGTVIAILDSCMHWVVCTSAEAQDPFSSMGPRATLSPRNLVIEILTKLSMKESNLDLILATRPYNRLEKLFDKLVVMVGDRKDQTLREFSIVLLSNLSAADCVAARAIALQKGAIANLIGFLEECEETGLNNRRMFPAGQERINCGTIPYMMKRCALTLLTLAKVRENRSLFLKHQLRLLSLSMSSLLGGVVLTLLSSVLYEIYSHAS